MRRWVQGKWCGGKHGGGTATAGGGNGGWSGWMIDKVHTHDQHRRNRRSSPHSPRCTRAVASAASALFHPRPAIRCVFIAATTTSLLSCSSASSSPVTERDMDGLRGGPTSKQGAGALSGSDLNLQNVDACVRRAYTSRGVVELTLCVDGGGGTSSTAAGSRGDVGRRRRRLQSQYIDPIQPQAGARGWMARARGGTSERNESEHGFGSRSGSPRLNRVDDDDDAGRREDL